MSIRDRSVFAPHRACSRCSSGAAPVLALLLLVVLESSVSAQPNLRAPFLAFETDGLPLAEALSVESHELAVLSQNESAGNPVISIFTSPGDGTLERGPSFPAPSSAVSIAIGRVNLDSRSDVVLGTSSGIEVWLRKADGTFQSLDFAAGSYPVAITIRDLNADGRPDIIGLVPSTNTMTVLLGTSIGLLAPHVDYPTGSSPAALALGDLDGDSDLDVAVANNSPSGSVSVFLNRGDGTFGSPTSFRALSPNGVAIGDLEGDGHADLATTNYGSATISIFAGAGDGTFSGPSQQLPTAYAPRGLVMADLDADSDLDLVVTSQAISIHRNAGGGSFLARQDFPAGPDPFPARVGDLNLDGVPDLVVVSASGHAAVLLGNGDGSFGTHHFLEAGEPIRDVAIGDLDGDGRNDVVATRDGSVSVFRSGCCGAFEPRIDVPVGSGVGPIALGDLNGDGRPDVATAGYEGLSVLLAQPGGGLGAPVGYLAGEWIHDVGIGDFTGDGVPDVLVTRSPGLAVLPGIGDGDLDAPIASPAFARQLGPIAVGDLNGDGRLDAMLGDSIYPWTLSAIGSGDGTFASGGVFSTDGYIADGLALADLDLDGSLDLGIAAPCYYQLHCFDRHRLVLGHGNGDGTLASSGTQPVGVYAIAVTAADLDQAGGLELAVANSGSNTVSVVPGTEVGAPHRDFGVDPAPRSVAAGDLNGDGMVDLAVGGGTSLITLLYNVTNVTDVPVSVAERGPRLGQSVPNPTRGPLWIGFSIPAPARVRLRVFDPSGRLVRTLLDEHRPAGEHRVSWDRRARSGSLVPPGVYLYELLAGANRVTRRMAILD